MKRNQSKASLTLYSLAASSALLLAQASLAAEDKPASFWIDHDVLTWKQTTVKPDKGDTDKYSSLVTSPNDVTVGIFWQDYGLYVSPGDAGGLIGASYYPTKEIEFGLLLGLSNDKSDTNPAGVSTTTESKTTKFGFWGEYYHTISSTSSAEFQLTYLGANSKNTVETPAATNTRSDTKSNGLILLAQYVYQVAPHFSVIPGIIYNMGTTKDNNAGANANTKTKDTTLSLNIAHFRYSF